MTRRYRYAFGFGTVLLFIVTAATTVVALVHVNDRARGSECAVSVAWMVLAPRFEAVPGATGLARGLQVAGLRTSKAVRTRVDRKMGHLGLPAPVLELVSFAAVDGPIAAATGSIYLAGVAALSVLDQARSSGVALRWTSPVMCGDEARCPHPAHDDPGPHV